MAFFPQAIVPRDRMAGPIRSPESGRAIQAMMLKAFGGAVETVLISVVTSDQLARLSGVIACLDRSLLAAGSARQKRAERMRRPRLAICSDQA